jgi:hypothetical protein
MTYTRGQICLMTEFSMFLCAKLNVFEVVHEQYICRSPNTTLLIQVIDKVSYLRVYVLQESTITDEQNTWGGCWTT